MSTTASVEILTAEVRVLMVGKRQVTLSVFRQLDYILDPTRIDWWGRVHDPRDNEPGIQVIGRDDHNGALAFTRVYRWKLDYASVNLHKGYGCEIRPGFTKHDCQIPDDWYQAAQNLPLIVLAGLT